MAANISSVTLGVFVSWLTNCSPSAAVSAAFADASGVWNALPSQPAAYAIARVKRACETPIRVTPIVEHQNLIRVGDGMGIVMQRKIRQVILGVYAGHQNGIGILNCKIIQELNPSLSSLIRQRPKRIVFSLGIRRLRLGTNDRLTLQTRCSNRCLGIKYHSSGGFRMSIIYLRLIWRPWQLADQFQSCPAVFMVFWQKQRVFGAPYHRSQRYRPLHAPISPAGVLQDPALSASDRSLSAVHYGFADNFSMRNMYPVIINGLYVRRHARYRGTEQQIPILTVSILASCVVLIMCG